MQEKMKADLEAPLPAGQEDFAIRCRDVCRSYGKLKVLNDLNLAVPQGQIYGLLGPSGCGKTTLLKCIVGTLKISRGHITVLGKPPAFPGHDIPGKKVGYMPQELALYNELTISDTLTFFGRIHGLTSKETQARMNFLIDFLDLPQKTSLVRNLSKAVAGTAAILKQTPLLSGSSVSRIFFCLLSRIWHHLVEIVKTGKVSVIITTHYIEEATQANVPILSVLQTLEHAFLQLCETSDQVDSKRDSSSPDGTLEKSQSFESGKDESQPVLGVRSPPAEEMHWKVRARHVLPKWRNIAALMIKTFVRMKRMPGFLCFLFLLPVIQISLICLVVGEPKGIRVAIVNNETSPSAFSQSFLSFLDNSSVQQVNLSHKEAFEGIYNGEYWGVIAFGRNFTSYLIKRMLQRQVSQEIIDGGSIHVCTPDFFLKKQMHHLCFALCLQAFVDYKLGGMAYMVALPIKFEEPIYNSQNTDFTTFVTPGSALSITFYLAVGLTALSFVLERKEGLLDRCWVAGEPSKLTLLPHSHLVIFFLPLLFISFSLSLSLQNPNEGSLVLVIILMVLEGVTGISLGLVISSAIDDEQSANQAALGIFYPNLILSGIFWPVECIPYPLSYLSLVLPLTYASEALRCIMCRGWDLSRMMVWRGFAVTLGWNILFLILATVILKLRM
uniref:ABC transporter G family member 20 n=1 Tax=Maylandia zebra TaxID=106582 RepID=A0A3P9DPF9_9CICH